MKTATAEQTIVPSYRIEKRQKAVPAFELVDGKIMLAKDAVVADGDGYFEGLSGATVDLPELTVGSDYLIFCTGDALRGTIATREGLARPDVLGGFHYAPGGNAIGRAGGDDAPAINPCSIWDSRFRPACGDPRGMTYVAGVPGSEGLTPFWGDIYLLGVDHLEVGTSVFCARIADGRDNRPLAPGGLEVKLDYATAQRIYAGHGKSLMSFAEFAAATYGVIERQAAGTRPRLTGLDAPRTSCAGLMQAVGNLYVWGQDGDPDDPRASVFGGVWDNGEFAGSRFAYVGHWPDYSSEWIGARGRCDHLQLD